MRVEYPRCAMVFLLSVAAAQDCLSTEDMNARFDVAEAAYASLDVEGFHNTLDEVALSLSCLDQVVTPEFAARYHRMQGLRLYTNRETARAEQAFAAARRIEPETELLPELFPATHAIQVTYGALPSIGPMEPLPEPVSARIYVDGVEGTLRPAEQPIIVQVQEDGVITGTRYVFPGDALPRYESKYDPATAGGVRVNKPLLATALGAAVAGGVVYGMAYKANQDFWTYDDSYTLDDLETLQTQANRRVIVAGAMGGVAVASGVASFVLVGEF